MLELARLEALRRYSILDTPPEDAFDRITALAADICDVPIAAVALVDDARTWYKSLHGLAAPGQHRREDTFCARAILDHGPTVFPQASADPRTRDNPIVRQYGIKFYLGVPLRTFDGYAIGTLCCIDVRPRHIGSREVRQVTSLAAIAMDEIELRRSAREISAMCNAVAHALEDKASPRPARRA